MKINTKLKILRIQSGLKQGELAKAAGITQNYLSLLENDKAIPSLPLLEHLARIFNVPVYSFFDHPFSHDTLMRLDALEKEVQSLKAQLAQTKRIKP